MIILDTHALLWATQTPDQLGKETVARIEKHWQSKDIAVSAISFWECEMLQQKGRIQVFDSIEAWRNRLISEGLIEISVDGDIGVLSARLSLHGDSADRMIVATAIKAESSLVTADAKILAWNHSLLRHNARQ